MKMMSACENGEGQYDLARAKELQQKSDCQGRIVVCCCVTSCVVKNIQVFLCKVFFHRV